MQIYIARNGQQTGPFPLEEINRQLATGALSLSDQAWYDGAPGWLPLSKVPGVTTAATPAFAAPAPSVTPAAASPVYSAAAPSPGLISPYGGFWMRLLAAIVDVIIVSIVAWPVQIVLGLLFGGSAVSADGKTINASGFGLACVNIFLQFAIYFLYETMFTSSSMQATLGKKICGMKVTDLGGMRISFASAAARSVVKWFSYAFACIPAAVSAFMVGLGDRKQALHDLAANTYVIKGM